MQARLKNIFFMKNAPAPVEVKTESPAVVWQQQLIEDLPELLQKYKGREVEVKAMPAFQRNGAELYTKRGLFASTDILLTLQEDITEAQMRYQKEFSQEPGASFTSYLFWTLLQAFNKVPSFSYRYINGHWYHFANLPLFTTIAGVKGELNNVLLENVAVCSWKEFCKKLLEAKTKLESANGTTMYPYPVYASAHHLTNVKLSFTALGIPVPKKGLEIERPMFVLGTRFEDSGIVKMPVGVKLPHASLHPQLLEELLAEWRKLRSAQPNQSVEFSRPVRLQSRL